MPHGSTDGKLLLRGWKEPTFTKYKKEAVWKRVKKVKRATRLEGRVNTKEEQGKEKSKETCEQGAKIRKTGSKTAGCVNI